MKVRAREEGLVGVHSRQKLTEKRIWEYNSFMGKSLKKYRLRVQGNKEKARRLKKNA
jgi:hypothetical protein